MGLTDRQIRVLACPVGVPGITGKEPAVIAASVVAQLLQVKERRSSVLNFSRPTAANDKSAS
jgi:xanthine dehydrogenase accessory factor